MSLLLVGPAVLSIGSIMSRSWATGVIHKDFFVLFVLSLMFFFLGLFFKDKIKDLNSKDLNQFNAALLIVGSAYAYILLWLSLHAAQKNDDLAVMIALVTYTIIGLGTYFYGRTNSKHGMLMYGGTLLGFIVLRLLFVEVWSMALSGRIITFFLIGALLISTAFVGRGKNEIKV
jgi:FtsH-binding integral membrane protein